MWLNYHCDVVYTILGNANIRFRISLENAFKWYIYHPIWLNYLFGITHTVLCNTNIRFRISLKNGFKWYIYIKLCGWITILIWDWESPWKMLSNDIYIILFVWITFFGITHTVLCDTNIRFRISLENAFKRCGCCHRTSQLRRPGHVIQTRLV